MPKGIGDFRAVGGPPSGPRLVPKRTNAERHWRQDNRRRIAGCRHRPETDECRKALETYRRRLRPAPQLAVPKRTNAERHWRLCGRLSGGLVCGRVPKRTNAERHWRPAGGLSGLVCGRLSRNGRMPKGIGDNSWIDGLRPSPSSPETDECRKALETGGHRLSHLGGRRVPKRTNAERHWRLADEAGRLVGGLGESRNGRMPKGIGDIYISIAVDDP